MLRTIRFLMLGLAVAFTAGVSVDAEAKKKKKRKKRKRVIKGGYGTAGCGLGSIIFKAKPGFIQVISSTTNMWFGQTFAITSGTSNCDIPHMGMAAAKFIEINRQLVSKESARGYGESVNSLAEIFQCNDEKYFATKLKENFNSVFLTTDSYESGRQITQFIREDNKLNSSCSPSLRKG